MRTTITAGDYYLWDPLAAVLTLHPELGTAETRTVDVDIDGPETGRTTGAQSGTSVEVFTVADGRAAEAQLIEVLAATTMPGIGTEADLVIDPVACSSSEASIGAGPRVLELRPGDAAAADHAVAVGVLDPQRGAEDIEAFLANPTPGLPSWFVPVLTLGAGQGAVPADLADLVAGTTYTIVCVRGEWGAMELAGTTTLTVRG
jgi:hypothetical protein